MVLLNNRGSAFYIVLMFSIITLATTFIYVWGQYNFSQSSLRAPAKVQTLLNARSGIWYGLALLDQQKLSKSNTTSAPDSNSLSDLFGTDLFGHEQTNEMSNQDYTLLPGGEPLEITLFDSASYGYFTLALENFGNFRILESEGILRQQNAKVKATIGSQPFPHADTVLFLSTPGMPQGLGHVDGQIAFLSFSIDNADSSQKKRFYVDLEEVESIVNGFQESLMSISDSADRNPPLTIQYNDELQDIPDTIRGPLFIDGSSREITWKEQRTIYVLEELQLTGEVTIEEVKFIVNSDIKILDQTKLLHSEIFSAKRIFFAGESQFSGSAIANADIEIYEQAIITDKSTIISTGFSKEKLKGVTEKKKQATKTKKKGKKKLVPFSLYVRDQAMVDGILIDLKKLGGISTDQETIINGIMWSRARISHNGTIHGVVHAQVLVDKNEPLKVVRNTLNGFIKELETIPSYYLPYFIGTAKIIDWQEY